MTWSGPARLVDGYAGLRRRLAPARGRPGGVLVVSSGGLGDTVLFALVVSRFVGLAADGEPVTVLLRRDARKMAFLLDRGARVETVDYSRLRRDPGYRLGILGGLYAANYRLVVSTDYLRHPQQDEALIRACAAGETVAMEARPWPKHQAALGRNRALFERLFDSGPPLADKVVRWNAFADWLSGEVRAAPRVRLAVTGSPARRRLARVHAGPSASHLDAKCSSRMDRAMLASSGERIPP